MTFNWKSFEQAVLFTAPLVLPAFGVPAAAVNLVTHGILVAETISNGDPKTGDQKKSIALDAVKTGLDAVNEARPGTINTDELMSAVSSGIDATLTGVKAAKDIPAHQ